MLVSTIFPKSTSNFPNGTIVTLSLDYCYTVVTCCYTLDTLLLRCYFTVVLRSLHGCYTFILTTQFQFSLLPASLPSYPADPPNPTSPTNASHPDSCGDVGLGHQRDSRQMRSSGICRTHYLQPHTRTCTLRHINIYTHTHKHIHSHTHTHTHTHIYTHTHTHTYTHTHTRTHTHTHTHT
jgi:hypothetical protein